MRNIIFYLVLIIAAIGLVMNLDAFIFSIVRMLISFAVIAGIIYRFSTKCGGYII
ncbi:exported protein [Staphylococcus aureus]|nr:exported protein [Staphylococcus aureus]